MNYETYLDQFPTLTKKPTLDAVEYILKKLDNPQKKLKAIHIAGTNGKGSVAAYLNAMLSANKKITFGKFISPFLGSFNETITVNNEPILNSEIDDIIKKIDPIVKKYELEHGKVKWFEINFIIAVVHFLRKKCKYVIIEAGLGGLNDATNILKPLISVITSVGRDHQDLLGRSLCSVAKHKAGIIKANIPVVIPSDIRKKHLFLNAARLHNSEVIIADKKRIISPKYGMTETRFDYLNLKDITTPVIGLSQPINVIIAIETYKYLMRKDRKLLKSAIFSVKKTVHPGRFEFLSVDPIIIYDGAHNVDAIKSFIKTEKLLYNDVPKTLIISIIKTKKYKPMIRMLLKASKADFIFTNGTSNKFYRADKLMSYAKKINRRGKFQSLEFTKAIDKTKKIKTVFIVGSFYCYSKATQILK